MPQDRASRSERDPSLPDDYLTVDHIPSTSTNRLPVRAGTRVPRTSEVEADRRLESEEAKEG